MTKYDWLLVISAPVVAVYLWAAMFTNILSGRPFGIGAESWFGSLASILVGFFLLFVWLGLALFRMVALLCQGYGELTLAEKKVAVNISRNIAKELVQRAGRRRDKIGGAVRFILKVTRVV